MPGKADFFNSGFSRAFSVPAGEERPGFATGRSCLVDPCKNSNLSYTSPGNKENICSRKGDRMIRKVLQAVLVVLLLSGCAAYEHPGDTTDAGRPPVILATYAPEVIRPGSVWRVYLKATDPDGDMKEIVAVVWQTGFGYYPTDITRIKKDDAKEVAGYLFLNTPPEPTLLSDQFTLTLLVRDRQGNKSEPVEVHFHFDYVPPAKLPESWQPVAENRLGGILIKIQSSFRYNQGGEGDSYNLF
jgi:hypothetical protein